MSKSVLVEQSTASMEVEYAFRTLGVVASVAKTDSLVGATSAIPALSCSPGFHLVQVPWNDMACEDKGVF
jgi:hypothetical protein